MASFSVDPSLAGWNDKITAAGGRVNIDSGINAGQNYDPVAFTQQFRPVTDAQYSAYEQGNPNVVLPSAMVGGQRYVPFSYFGGDQGSGGVMSGGSSAPAASSAASSGAASSGAPTASQYPNFVPPDPNNPLTDPTLKFRLSQGTQAIQNGAAARGTLLTGATSKALNDYAQNEAATGYQQAYGNALSTYDTNRDTSQSGFNNGLSTFNANLAATGQAQNFSLSSQKLAADLAEQKLQDQMAQQAFTAQQQQQSRENARQAWLDAGGVGPLYGGYAVPGAPANSYVPSVTPPATVVGASSGVQPYSYNGGFKLSYN